MILMEKVDRFRALPEKPASAWPDVGNNFVLSYLARYGQLPAGWEMVFGVPRYTGHKRRKLKSLGDTRVTWPAVRPGLQEATTSRDVNPEVRDISPIPSPGGTQKFKGKAFRANLTSGNRTKTHQEDPHQGCDYYSPQCRDAEWETPIWIGGSDWVSKPVYHHPPPDTREVFAQDPLGLNPPDVPLADKVSREPEVGAHLRAHINKFRAARGGRIHEDTRAAGIHSSGPIGLLSRASSGFASKIKKSWLDVFRSGEATKTTVSPQIVARSNRRKRDDDDVEPSKRVFAVRHKSGTEAHNASLYKQAVELRRMIGKPFYIVDYKGRRVVTSRPQKHGKVLHVVEQGAVVMGGRSPGTGATTSAMLGAHTDMGNPFYGRRLLRSEKRRKKR